MIFLIDGKCVFLYFCVKLFWTNLTHLLVSQCPLKFHNHISVSMVPKVLAHSAVDCTLPSSQYPSIHPSTIHSSIPFLFHHMGSGQVFSWQTPHKTPLAQDIIHNVMGVPFSHRCDFQACSQTAVSCFRLGVSACNKTKSWLLRNGSSCSWEVTDHWLTYRRASVSKKVQHIVMVPWYRC